MVLMLAYLRSFRYLSFTSIYGDISVTAALLSVVIFGLIKEKGFTFDMSTDGLLPRSARWKTVIMTHLEKVDLELHGRRVALRKKL